jgi:hypothetical protein
MNADRRLSRTLVGVIAGAGTVATAFLVVSVLDPQHAVGFLSRITLIGLMALFSLPGGAFGEFVANGLLPVYSSVRFV